MEIVALPVPEFIDPDAYHILLTQVSADKREKIGKFHRKQDAYRSLLGDLLVRVTIGSQTGWKNEDIRFVYNSYGKPFLAGHDAFSFNLSHSGKWVVLMWDNQSRALGVDIEKIKAIDLAIAERFFNPSEYIDLMSKEGQNQLDYFFQLWTLKESYIKALGKGLSIPLNGFSLHPRRDTSWFSPQIENFYFKNFRIDQEYFLSACADMDDLPDTIKIIPFAELYDALLQDTPLEK